MAQLKHRIIWSGVKLGVWLIRSWAKYQYEIDGDYVQVVEVIGDFFEDYIRSVDQLKAPEDRWYK